MGQHSSVYIVAVIGEWVSDYDSLKWVDYIIGTDDADKFYLPTTHQFGLQPRGGDDHIVGGADAYSWVDYKSNDTEAGIIVV